ncbi:MAG: single-stranded DNA-binding protein [Pedobacter sp.]|uniref:single-stranded DNA-binding protein n=1 Tax=Pedobacter sp. TaxID=1411316 RepID=UPI0035657CE5
MGKINEIHIIGRVSQSGEIKPTANNLLYKFSIAVDGGKGKPSSFFNITAWDKMAEECSNIITKGAVVYVEGYLKQDTWKDKTTGANRSTVGIVATHVELEEDGKGQTQQKAEELPVDDDPYGECPF